MAAHAPHVELANRVALVTGSAMGTGRAIAVRLAAEGMRVVVADIDRAGCEETVRRIRADGGEARMVEADVTREPMVRSMVGFAEAEFDWLDVLVNNAGGTRPPHFPDGPGERWRSCLELNLLGPMYAIQAAVPALRRRGGGAIVNVASIAGVGGGAYGAPEYAAAKAGLIRLTEALADLRERDGIRVNCLAPNWILTDRTREVIAAMSDEQRAALPPPLSTPEDIAEGVVRLLRDDDLAGRVLMWWRERPHLVPERRWSAWGAQER
jgi:NAD(P)-dependent dehydrogenase (short-subunit alcohol dehydrogenase family)